jgi:endosialidase-like protein/trimeric autotransporter adhesin
MLLRASRAVFAALLAGMLALATSASGQPIGIFSWQLQPYCNVLTFNVTQTGTVFTLDGYDDQCGATTRASAAGLALQNPDGTIGLGVAIVLSPGAAPIHVNAALTPSYSGTWRDSSGNTGTLAFNPGATFGPPRPPPKPIFVAGLSAGGGTITDVAAPVNATDVATKGYADSLVSGLALPPSSQFKFQPDGGFAAISTFGTGTIPVGTAGARLMWHPAKAALRAGRVTGTQWSEFAIGAHSVAFGLDTRATADASTALGVETRAIGGASTAMGSDTLASGGNSLAIGDSTTASGSNSTAIGFSTTASGPNSVALGWGTVASGFLTTSTAMGLNTVASGSASTAMGIETIASGTGSTAMGTRAIAAHVGTFVYGDASNTPVSSTSTNQFIVRATGAVRFFTNDTHTSGVQLSPGASAWTALSDVNRKHQFRDLDGDTVLAKLAAMPIREWSYKAQDAAIRHVGPTAQDFHAAFGLGEDPLGISTIDADGIALRTIQALEARTRRQIAALEEENRALRAELAVLRKTLAAAIDREP